MQKMSTDDGRNGLPEITLNVRDDSVAVQSVKTAGGADVDDSEQLNVLAKGSEKRSSVVKNASSRIRQVSSDLKRLTTFSKPKRQPLSRLDRSKPVATYALKGLKFISKTDGATPWADLEKRFDRLTAATNGLLPRSLFGECIGNNSIIHPCMLFTFFNN